MTVAILLEGQNGGSWNFETLGQVKIKSQDCTTQQSSRSCLGPPEEEHAL